MKQMAMCPKDTSFYIIITSDVQWVQKNLIVQKTVTDSVPNSN